MKTQSLGENALPFDSFAGGDSFELVSEDALPFKRLKITPDDEEEESVRTESAWVVDLQEPRLAASVLKWLKQAGLETPSMAHLKRIRKIGDELALIIALTSEHPQPPKLPEDAALPPPYVLKVPKTAALTMNSLKLKSSLWPTVYAPRKKFEPEPWTRGKVRWACEAMKLVIREAQEAREKGEMPIAAYVPVPYEDETRTETRMYEPISAHDTRTSLHHPLRHSVINIVRAVGELRASRPDTAMRSSPNPPTQVAHTDVLKATEKDPKNQSSNGAHYLLTSLTLFTTHEPCIMCSMALLHSRVKEIVYIIPMEKTGGCGSLTCVPRLEGVNHRYAVDVWKDLGNGWVEKYGLQVGDACDA